MVWKYIKRELPLYHCAICLLYSIECFRFFDLKVLYHCLRMSWIIYFDTRLISLMFREQEQWAQCDSCSKWRRLPVDILLPSKWMCTDNVWDQNRLAIGFLLQGCSKVVLK